MFASVFNHYRSHIFTFPPSYCVVCTESTWIVVLNERPIVLVYSYPQGRPVLHLVVLVGFMYASDSSLSETLKMLKVVAGVTTWQFQSQLWYWTRFNRLSTCDSGNKCKLIISTSNKFHLNTADWTSIKHAGIFGLGVIDVVLESFGALSQSNPKTAVCWEKRIEIWDSGTLVTHVRGTFDLAMINGVWSHLVHLSQNGVLLESGCS